MYQPIDHRFATWVRHLSFNVYKLYAAYRYASRMRSVYSCAIVDCINNRDRINSAEVSESKLIRSKCCFPTIEFLGFVCTACCYRELEIVTLNVSLTQYNETKEKQITVSYIRCLFFLLIVNFISLNFMYFLAYFIYFCTSIQSLIVRATHRVTHSIL